MIVNGKGQLVWFDPVPQGEIAADFREQTLQGKEVLTWFQGAFIDGHGVGADVIMNDRYQVVDRVRASNGYSTDLHEFLVGPGRTAWVVSYNTIGWDLRSVGGPSDAAVYDCVVQELDIGSGNVLFEWHSLDHVPLTDSYIPYSRSQATPYDYFHLNSVDPTGGGSVLISGRNTDALYLVSQATGNVVWTLGGKSSSFLMGPGAEFALQHDAELVGTSKVTLFDDEDDTADGLPARAIELRLNLSRHYASLVWARQVPGYLLVLDQGSVQLLQDGNVMVGWGAGGYTTESSKKGKILFEAHFGGLTSSYRAYRNLWSGQPTSRPAVASQAVSGGGLTVFASWNGATTVKSWRVLGGPSSANLRSMADSADQGFETAIRISQRPLFLEVEALGHGGRVLARSELVTAG
jgi:hypothetical protein